MTVASLQVTYTTVELITKTLPEVMSASNVTSSLLAHYAGRAQAEIDARISVRYALPLGTAVPLLTSLATDMALYYTLSRKPLIGSQTKADPWLERFKEARDLLKEIAAGEVPLVGADGAALQPALGTLEFWSNTRDYKPTFYEGEPETWEPDQEKLDDEAGRRD